MCDKREPNLNIVCQIDLHILFLVLFFVVLLWLLLLVVLKFEMHFIQLECWVELLSVCVSIGKCHIWNLSVGAM